MPCKLTSSYVSEKRAYSSLKVRAVQKECLDPKGGAGKIIRNVGYYLPIDTQPCFRKLKSSI